MRGGIFCIAATCVLATVGLLPAQRSGAPPADTEKVIYSFEGGLDGATPLSDLTLDAAGNIYGTTVGGGGGAACGKEGCGTVFELNRTESGWNEHVLYSFAGGSDGAYPQAGVIFDKAGNLYGTTAGGGGGQNAGTVFKLTPNSRGGWIEAVIYRFNFYGKAGNEPQADLVLDPRDNLFGTTATGAGGPCLSESGCGAVFELKPQADGSWTETTLHTFTGAPDGGVPNGLVLDAAGNLYGMTQVGGAGKCRPTDTFNEFENCGTLYKLTPNVGGPWKETILYSFVRGAGRGVYPSGTLFLDNVDLLFGVTQAGGDGIGTVVAFDGSQNRGWKQNVLHIFQGPPRDGAGPTGRLLSADGILFGVTSEGGFATGQRAVGTVFKLERAGNVWKEKILHTFTGSPDGSKPSAGLASDSQGHLYGTTASGGAGTGCYAGCGTVFEITP